MADLAITDDLDLGRPKLGHTYYSQIWRHHLLLFGTDVLTQIWDIDLGCSIWAAYSFQVWQLEEGDAPDLVRKILLHIGGRSWGPGGTMLCTLPNEIDSQLLCFGRLYMPVLRKLGLIVMPRTKHPARGNDVRMTAGPKYYLCGNCPPCLPPHFEILNLG